MYSFRMILSVAFVNSKNIQIWIGKMNYYLYNIGDQVWESLVDFNLFCVFFDLLLLCLQLVRNPHDLGFHYLKMKCIPLYTITLIYVLSTAVLIGFNIDEKTRLDGINLSDSSVWKGLFKVRLRWFGADLLKL